MLTDNLLWHTGKIPKNSKNVSETGSENLFFYGQVFVFDTIQKEELLNASLELIKENCLSYPRRVNE